MKTPTLEEVKEYFKNAKEVKDSKNDLPIKLNIEKLYFSRWNNWCVKDDNGSITYLWSSRDGYNGYAEIVSYIEPTYTLTKEQLSCLHTIDSVKETIEEWFPSEFPKLEVGKWYKYPKYGKSIICVTEIVDNNIYGYGFNYKGLWENNCLFGNNNNTHELATPQEVEEALTKEAVKRGYKNRNYKCLFMPKQTCRVVKDNFLMENDSLWHGTKGNANNVFSNGVWAEIISEPIEVTLEEIAKLKGVDVSLIKIVK